MTRAHLTLAALFVLGIVSMACGNHAVPETSGTPKAAITSREVTFEVKGLTLSGTLQLPGARLSPESSRNSDTSSYQRDISPAPALLLLPGSGPTDRDGNSSVLTEKVDLLKQIAEELAKNGIASLRFDKRAIRTYQAKWPKDMAAINQFFSWPNFVDDASTAFDFLAKQPEIDPARVGILGHSEGALISLQIDSDRSGKSNAPRATILLGGTGRPMGIVIHEQISRLLKKQQAPADVAKTYIDYTDAACAALAAGKPLPPNTPQGLVTLFNPSVLDIVGAYCRIDPVNLAKKSGGDFLVMNGAHDTQVSADRDTPLLVAALKGRSGGTVDSLIIPDASHNLKSTASGNDDATAGPMNLAALNKIIEFAKKSL